MENRVRAGRPREALREDYRPFWTAIASGRSSEDAAVEAGVSPAVGVRWFRRAGGMPPTHLSRSSKPPSERYLSFAEREEIAILRAQGHGVRAIARQLDRPPCTISRELRRNVARRHGAPEYRATTAQWHADRSARRPKLASWQSIRPCGIMCTTGLPVWSPSRTGGPSLARRSCGRDAGLCIGKTGAGRRHGARNRFLGDFGSTFPRMRRCASVTRRSIRRFMCRVEELCVAN